MNDSSKEGEWDWEAEFDKRIDASKYEAGQYHHLKEGDHLLDPEWYPESAYEIDPEKVKSFIRQNFISKHSLIKKIEGMRQPLVTEDMPPMSYAYNQALDNLLTYLKGEDNEK